MEAEIIALTGFMAAGYSVVANDVIQTLGTFLTSNAKRHWVILWAYAAVILSATLIIGWILILISIENELKICFFQI